MQLFIRSVKCVQTNIKMGMFWFVARNELGMSTENERATPIHHKDYTRYFTIITDMINWCLFRESVSCCRKMNGVFLIFARGYARTLKWISRAFDRLQPFEFVLYRNRFIATCRLGSNKTLKILLAEAIFLFYSFFFGLFTNKMQYWFKH